MARKIVPEPDDDGGGELVGYARVSTMDQSLQAQLDALHRHGVKDEHIYTDQISAVSNRRRGLEQCLKSLRRGDTLVVYALSRLGRSTENLLAINKRLLEEGVGLRSLTEPIDTTTADGRLLFTVRAAFAQFERDVTIERTRAGLKAREEAGFKLGRPREISDKKLAAIERDLADVKLSLAAIARKHKVAPANVRYHFPKPRIEYLKPRK